jgi:hypothetical protein
MDDMGHLARHNSNEPNAEAAELPEQNRVNMNDGGAAALGKVRSSWSRLSGHVILGYCDEDQVQVPMYG